MMIAMDLMALWVQKMEMGRLWSLYRRGSLRGRVLRSGPWSLPSPTWFAGDATAVEFLIS